MNNVDPKLLEVLAKLKDIKLPEDPSWWPPAPGRIIIILIIFSIVAFVIKKIYTILSNKYSNYLKQAALKELDNIVIQIQNGNKISTTDITIVGLILKKCAINKYKDKYKDKYIASLSGREWLEFLDTTWDTTSKLSNHYFTSTNAENINNLKYVKHLDAGSISHETINQVKEFILNSKLWISHNL